MAAVDAPEAPEAVEEGVKSPGRRLYEFSSWLHVGPGAEECADVEEEKGESNCSNRIHFHAWCRVPNQYEARDIATKALAAKARKARQLRDEDSDASQILDDEMESIAALGDEGKATLVMELVQRDWFKDYLEAEQEVLELEADDPGEGEPDKKYALIKEDERRFAELEAMPEDERPADEYAELEKHLAAFHQDVKDHHDQIQESKRAPLMGRDINALIDMVRKERVVAMANDEFHHVRRSWTMVYGVLRLPNGDQVWNEPEDLRRAPQEVLAAVNVLFDDLERMENSAADPS